MYLLIITKGQCSVKMNVELYFLFSAHWLKLLYIHSKFRGNILDGFRVRQRTRFVTDRHRRIDTDRWTDRQTDRQLQK